MSQETPVWRGAAERRDGRREWIRQNLPAGPAGFVAEDLDLVARVYGREFYTDATGKLALIEFKLGDAPFGASKERTFRLLDDLCRAGDVAGERYRGFFVVRTPDETWSESTVFNVNGVDLTADQFRLWLLGNYMGVDPCWSPAMAWRQP